MNMLNTAITPHVEATRCRAESKRNTLWTEEEKSILLEMRALKSPAAKIAERLGRPVGSVYVMARKLDSKVMRYERWTEEKDKVLADAISEGTLSDSEIAEKIGVSYSSVRWRIGALGLQGKRPDRGKRANTAPNAWSDAEIARLTELAGGGALALAEAAAEIGRPLGGVRAKAKELGLSFPRPKDLEAEKAVEELRAVWSSVGDIALVAARLGRSESWVRSRTIELGLRHTRSRNTRRLDAAAKEEIGVSFHRATRKKSGPTPKARRKTVPKPKMAARVKPKLVAPAVATRAPEAVAATRSAVEPPQDRIAMMRAVLARMKAQGRMPG